MAGREGEEGGGGRGYERGIVKIPEKGEKQAKKKRKKI